MYYWRQINEQERQNLLEDRKRDQLPWHLPRHIESDSSSTYLVTGTCYEHANFIGFHAKRMQEFETELLIIAGQRCAEVHAWCVLPNHYHLLVRTRYLKPLTKALGELHGRSSRAWNQEEGSTGRQVFHGTSSRYMRSHRHFWTTLNYMHHNPVKHGLAKKWQDWPWTSAHQFMEALGEAAALEIWRNYPILDYGDKWDVG